MRYKDILYKGTTANGKARERDGRRDYAHKLIACCRYYKAIESAASGRQVIMIDEEHRTTVNRAVTLRLNNCPSL